MKIFLLGILSVLSWMFLWRIGESGICSCKRFCHCGKKKKGFLGFVNKVGKVTRQVAPYALPFSALIPGAGGLLGKLGGLLGKGAGALTGLLGGGKNNLLGEDLNNLLGVLPSGFLSNENPSMDIFNIQKGAYEAGAPGREKARQFGLSQLGTSPYKTFLNPEAITSQKTANLADYDYAAKRAREARNEALISAGINKSGPGFEDIGNLDATLARNRALLSSNFDVTGMQTAEQGQQNQYNYNRLLGLSDPLSLLGYADKMPSFTEPQQDNTAALLSYLLGGSSLGGTTSGGPEGDNNLLQYMDPILKLLPALLQ